MAGIFANIDSDISKIRQLKSEIEKVKKALTSINVKVDIDIAKGMEAQLKSLTAQYDALVQKVAQAEAKIAESTARINKSAETVIKAQEQMAKAASGQGAANAQGTSGGNTAATNAQTASVQAQARAYDELANEIDAVMGTRSQNIRRMIEEQNAIRIINEEIKKLTKYQSGSSTLSASQQKRLEQLNASLLTHKTALSELRQSLNNSFKLDAAAATSMNALSQSLARMRMTYRELTEEERNSTFGKELLASIQQADAKIKQLDATIGNHQRNVGNYASGWNGLGMSIQQIGRELPSLAMGWNTFFLAISNNLPILTDEIKRAKDEYNRLKEAGQQATPVWKQVVSSLLSWQTALTVGITLLTLYGKDIIEWVGNLFKAKDGTKELEEAMKRLNTAISGVYGNASEEMRVLKDLNKSLENAKRGTEEWNQIRNKLVTGYSKYLPSIDQEIDKTGTLANSYDRLAESIQKAAAARGFEEYSSEEDEKYMEVQNKNLEKVAKAFQKRYGDENWTKFMDAFRKYMDSNIEVPQQIQDLFSKTIVNNWTGETANSLLFEIRKQQEARDKSLQEFRNIFGMTEGTEESLPSDSIKALRDRIAANREALEKLSVSSKEYKDLLASIQKDEQRLSLLTSSQNTAQSEINSAKSYLDELAKLREENEDREIDLMKEGTEKKLAEIELRYKREKESIINQQRELAEANKEAGITSTNASGLTTEQQTEIDRASELLAKQRTKQVLEVYKEEFSAMRDNLEEYGNYQQQKLALAQEYAEKIAAAQTEGERRSLEQERDNRMSAIETQRLKSEIDWSVAFGEFGGMFADVIRPVLEQARQYMQTDEFKNADHDSQRTLIDAVQQMEESLGGASKVNFKKLASDIDAYRKSLVQLRNAQGQYDDAYKELSEAQQEYLEALENGTDAEKEAAKQAVDEAQSKVDAASVAVDGLTESSEKAKTAITDTATTLKTSMDGVVGGLQKLTSGSLRGAYDGLIELGKSAKNISGLGKVGDAMGTIAKGLENVPIVGWIASILDVLKDGLTDFIQTIHDSATSAVTNIFGDIFSGDLFKQGFNNTLESIEKTIGMFGIDFSFSGSNAKEVQATIDRLTDRNEALQQSIDALNDTMKEARGTETVKAAKQAEEYQKEVNQNYLEMAMAQAGYHGSHRSWNYYWGGFSKEQIDKLSEQIGREWSGSLWDLSPEEMKMLKGNVDMWTQIQNTGEGGYGGRLTEKLDDYIDQAGKLEEITDTLYESLTQISFDSMYDSFVDNLMNMEYSAQDAADDIAEYFMRAMLSNKIGALYQDKLEEWYKKFAGAMEDDGTLDDGEIAALRDEYLGYVEEALKLRDELAAATGYDGTSDQEQQSATSRGFETMTQDQASELNGRFTALYESSLRQESIQQGIGNIAEDARNIIAQSYLELQQISENTGAIIIPIQKIQKDIEQVKQNTSRL